jgi:hypothetical protein
MAFGKKKEEIEKPNKIKIDIKFDKVRDNITERLDAYENKLEIIRQKIVAAKRANNNIEAKHQTDNYKQISVYKYKTQDLLNKLENFQFMIDEAFTKMELYETFGEVMGEVSKINASVEVKGMLKDIQSFEKNFSAQFQKLDQMFGVVTKSISDVDQSTKTEIDSELEAQLDREMQQLDEDTTSQAQEVSVSNW